jgi:cell division protein FtsZ
VIDDALGEEVRVTVIAAGFDRELGQEFRPPLLAQRPRTAEDETEGEEDIPVPSLLRDAEEEDDLFQPAPAPAGARPLDDGDDDLDIPDFLK